MVNTLHTQTRKIGKRVVVESGSAQAQVSAEKALLSKKPAEVTDGQLFQESVVFSDGESQKPLQTFTPAASGSANAGHLTFRDLDPTERQDAKRIMKDLDKKARLFARDDKEQLVRISPATAKQLLDKGQEIEVVSRLGSQTDSSGRSSSADFHRQHAFIPDDHYHSSSSTSERTVKVEYSASPINDWDSVLWHDDEDAQGVPGTPKLPSSGKPVVVSHEWENRWKNSSAEHTGFFRVKSDIEASNGYQTIREVSEG